MQIYVYLYYLINQTKLTQYHINPLKGKNRTVLEEAMKIRHPDQQ
jgi:hypothetical protein